MPAIVHSNTNLRITYSKLSCIASGIHTIDDELYVGGVITRDTSSLPYEPIVITFDKDMNNMMRFIAIANSDDFQEIVALHKFEDIPDYPKLIAYGIPFPPTMCESGASYQGYIVVLDSS